MAIGQLVVELSPVISVTIEKEEKEEERIYRIRMSSVNCLRRSNQQGTRYTGTTASTLRTTLFTPSSSLRIQIDRTKAHCSAMTRTVNFEPLRFASFFTVMWVHHFTCLWVWGLITFHVWRSLQIVIVNTQEHFLTRRVWPVDTASRHCYNRQIRPW